MSRRRWVGLGVAIVVAGGLGWWWWNLAPSVVRRLPGGETIVYVNLKALRQAQAMAPVAAMAVQRDASYQAFVQASGFDFERDLDGVGLALEGSPAAARAATAILEGRFGKPFNAWLGSHARRKVQVAGHAAYEFPGWARPQQTMTVVPLDADTLLVTNAAAAEAVVARAARGWPRSLFGAPRLWQPGHTGRALVGYAASDIQQLAAERTVDGSELPWRGVQSLRLLASVTPQGVQLNLIATADSASDAAAQRQWVESQRAALGPLLGAGGGSAASVGRLLEGIRVSQQGEQVGLHLGLSAEQVRALTPDAH